MLICSIFYVLLLLRFTITLLQISHFPSQHSLILKINLRRKRTKEESTAIRGTGYQRGTNNQDLRGSEVHDILDNDNTYGKGADDIMKIRDLKNINWFRRDNVKVHLTPLIVR